jgi:hypothetical protein
MEAPLLRRFHHNSTLEFVRSVAGDETMVEIASSGEDVHSTMAVFPADKKPVRRGADRALDSIG